MSLGKGLLSPYHNIDHAVGHCHCTSLQWCRDHSQRALLSSGAPPRCEGYSQSRSRPSKPYSWRKGMVLAINLARDSLVLAMSEYFDEPSFQPPMANKVIRFGFCSLSPVNLR